MLKILIGYLIIMNIIGIVIMFIDKEKAKNHQWRVSEKMLFLVSIIGGSLGTFLGMQLFRHKTKHAQFVIGFPAILIIHIGLAVFFFLKLTKKI